jgi:hypothetical protein
MPWGKQSTPSSSTSNRRTSHWVIRLAVLLLITIGLVAATGSAASAHTNSVSATCAKLSVNLSNYQSSGGQNHVTVTVDGAQKADTAFGSSYSQLFPFADETVAHSWTVKVTAWDDPDAQKGWTFTKSGTSVPCAPPDACPDLAGTQPPGTMCTPPHSDYEKREVRGTPNCEHQTITVEKQKRTRTYAWDGDSWEAGPWSEWTTYSTYKVTTTPEDCPGKEVTAAAPTYTPPSCTDAPHLTYAGGEGYHWVASGPDTARVLDAVAEDGYVLVGQTHYGPYDLTSWTLAEKIKHGCVGELVDVSVHQSTACDTFGSIDVPVSALVTYTISGGSWTDLAAGDYVVTATLTGGALEFANTLGWTVSGPTATRTLHVDAPLTCVTPSASTSPQVCVPEQPGGVTPGAITTVAVTGIAYTVRNAANVVVDPAALAPGTYTVTAVALSGYQLVDGNGFVGGVLTLTVLPPEENCTTEAPVKPAVKVVDECYTTNDAVTFDANTAYWTAAVTDSTHVTFTAKPGYYFVGDGGAKVTQLVLTHAATTDEQCPLVPGDVGASCVGDVPYLDYAVTLPEGFGDAGPTPLTITFVNPAGDDYVVQNLPLSGRLLWPGASATEPLMWPGWDLVGGEYVNVGDANYGWTRNGITVAFDVNPHYQTTLTYPPASVACANPPGRTPPPPAPPSGPPPTPPTTTPPTTPPGLYRPPPTTPATPGLPNTGGPNGGLVGLGAFLLLAGVALVRRAGRVTRNG